MANTTKPAADAITVREVRFRVGQPGFRTRWIAPWFEVYLKTASKSMPVAAATIVAEIQPGTTPTGASSNLPMAFATALSQAAMTVFPKRIVTSPVDLIVQVRIGKAPTSYLIVYSDRNAASGSCDRSTLRVG